MNVENLLSVLAATLDPTQHKQAEEHLEQINNTAGFLPLLFQVVMSSDVSMPIRQVGAVYFKNMVIKYWADNQGDTFTISEQDRALIRDSIIQAVVQAPEFVSTQLSVCVNYIVKYDFPMRWTGIVEKINTHLQNNESVGWKGALICLYQLVKCFEYKKAKDRAPLNEAMRFLLPSMYQLCTKILLDQSEQSVLLQKQILKIYFALTHYTLSLDLITAEVFLQWMEIIRAITDRPIPEQAHLSGDEIKNSPWWKCKKWAIRISYTIFENYGSPGNVTKEYAKFAEWYLKTFSAGIVEVLLKILEQYRIRQYVSPKVLEYSINYINTGVSHAFTWKLLKPHLCKIIQEILFPILSFSAEDEELWNSDPCEYIRVKYDDCETFITSAQTLLYSCCRKRKELLEPTMNFIARVLKSPSADARQRDGALHMLGILIDALRKKKDYKNRMDSILSEYVYPEFSNNRGHIRGRACWVIQEFSEFDFKEKNILLEAVRLIITTFLTDTEIPVKIEAAIALRRLLKYQEETKKIIEPQIKQIVLELLNIIRQTENEDLTSVMRRIVRTYATQLMPVAVEICQHLAATLSQVLGANGNSDEKTVTAMSLLNTIETLLMSMEDQKTVIEQLQPTVLQIVGHIFTQNVTQLYEEALSIVCELTSKSISPDMWKVLELIYIMFQKNGVEYFTDMMPTLFNYITVDTAGFLSNESYILAIFNMCKSVLNTDTDEDSQCHAAKLLEVIILQCIGRIDQCIFPFVEAALQRLNRQVKTSELRTMCLQVVVAALYYNHQVLFQALDKIQTMSSFTESIVVNFIKQWLYDISLFKGLHDRKLCVLGLCVLINLSPRLEIINSCAGQLIPSLLTLFDGLNKVYEAKANDSDDESSDADSDGGEFLSSDEETDYSASEYSRERQRKADVKGSEDFEDQTDLEFYITPLDQEGNAADEYIALKEVLQNMQANDTAWYQALTINLTLEQQKALQEVIAIADQRKAAADSKMIK